MTEVKERTLISFDWAMKSILRDKANFDVLEGFLSTLLERNIQVLSLLESEGNSRYADDKFNRVDLAVVDEHDEILLIEIQHDLDIDHLRRLLYGASKLITDHIGRGKPYAQVRKVISISIVYFQLQEKPEDYLYHGYTEFYGWHTRRPLPQPALTQAVQRQWMKSDTQAIFPEYYLIDVATFANVVQSAIDEWVYMFKNSAIRDDFRAKNIQAAREKLDYLKMDETERKAYEEYLFNRTIHESVLHSAFTSGREEGQLEKQHDIARKMRQEGLDPALIARITGLSEAELLAL